MDNYIEYLGFFRKRVASGYFLVLPRPINFDVEHARVSSGPCF